jgi:hypothetical protein
MKSLHFICSFLIVSSCVGPEGKISPAGKNSLVNISEELPGVNCVNGGQKIDSGLDRDGDNVLSSTEVSDTKYVCNGKNSLVNIVTEPSGLNCKQGGLKIETGLDGNGNNLLELSEIIQTKYLCHGQNGLNSLSVYSNEPVSVNCRYGGFKVQLGLDTNSDLLLSNDEIQSTKYMCFPSPVPSGNNSDKQIRIEIGESNVPTISTDWYMVEFQTFRLIKFNKLNYYNVDSITFVPSMYTSDPTNTVTVELFNVSDNVPIANTQISSNVNDWIFKESQNIYQHLPEKEITLGIRLKSENSDYSVSTGIRSYLFIYKR